MNEQVISLEIKDRSLTKLAGNSYGRKLFDAQVDGQIDLNKILMSLPPRFPTPKKPFWTV